MHKGVLLKLSYEFLSAWKITQTFIFQTVGLYVMAYFINTLSLHFPAVVPTPSFLSMAFVIGVRQNWFLLCQILY